MTERKSLLKEFMLPSTNSLPEAQKLLVSDDGAIHALFISSKNIVYVKKTTDPNVQMIRYNNWSERYAPITMAKLSLLMKRTGCAVVDMDELRADSPAAHKRLPYAKPSV
jgi:hypothetical protein